MGLLSRAKEPVSGGAAPYQRLGTDAIALLPTAADHPGNALLSEHEDEDEEEDDDATVDTLGEHSSLALGEEDAPASSSRQRHFQRLAVEDESTPSEVDRLTLRRVPGPVPFAAFLIATIELAERFSFYGSTVCFTNFVQFPLPDGSTTGAGRSGQSGALGLGQRASTGFGILNNLWAYLTPVAGAAVADARLGRFRTISWAVLIAIVGHVLLTASAAPSAIAVPRVSISLFTLAILVMGTGSGAFKSNVSPLIAEQVTPNRLVLRTLASGERVVVDPALTVGRVFLLFYMCINVGALSGQVSMVYAENRYGFQTAFLLPTLVFVLSPIILFLGRHRYVRTPPSGSVVVQLFRFLRFAAARGSSPFAPDFWERSKPSGIAPEHRPRWMTMDDAWVDEVRRGLNACAVFLFFPIYWLTYNQISNNLVSQAAVLDTRGIPNDLLSNVDPIAIIVLIPFCDSLVYPALARARFRFTPIRKITFGFVTGSLAMFWSFLVQREIYSRSPCGRHASTCPEMPFVDLAVFVQVPSYVLIAISEILASVTGLEYAFMKAPSSMKSLVTSIFLLQSAISSALGFLFLPLSADPYLDVNYALFSFLAMTAAAAFWILFRSLDAQEDELNALPAGNANTDGV